MLFLYIFGNNIEDRFGRLRFLGFYLVAGFVAAYGFSLFNASSTDTLVGASGAIAGVLGAYLLLFPRAKVLSLLPFLFFIPVRLPAWLVLGSWFLLQYFYATGSGMSDGAGVAYVAHVVGFLFGALVGYGVRRRRA
jgi:membrane associated rhomboid family serine protease